MKWVLIVAGGLIGVVVLVAVIGFLLPKGHVASRTVRLKQTPEVVWEAITDFKNQAAWRSDVKSVERLPDRGGREVWSEVNSWGQPLTMETVELAPPQRLVRRIADDKLPFGGTWTWEIAPLEGGCTVTITEDGEIYNPFFRFMARFVLGYRGTMDTYLTALGKKFGEEVELSN